MLESKRLLLGVVERRYEVRRRPDDARAIKRLRNEIELAERRCKASRAAASSAIGDDQRAETHARLIDRAARCAARLSASAPLLLPLDRLRVAVRVQALDDMVDEARRDTRQA